MPKRKKHCVRKDWRCLTGPDRRVATGPGIQQRAGRTHVAFGESAGRVRSMIKRAPNDFAAHTQRLAMLDGRHKSYGSEHQCHQAGRRKAKILRNRCVRNVWRLESVSWVSVLGQCLELVSYVGILGQCLGSMSWVSVLSQCLRLVSWSLS